MPLVTSRREASFRYLVCPFCFQRLPFDRGRCSEQGEEAPSRRLWRRPRRSPATDQVPPYYDVRPSAMLAKNIVMSRATRSGSSAAAKCPPDAIAVHRVTL